MYTDCTEFLMRWSAKRVARGRGWCEPWGCGDDFNLQISSAERVRGIVHKGSHKNLWRLSNRSWIYTSDIMLQILSNFFLDVDSVHCRQLWHLQPWIQSRDFCCRAQTPQLAELDGLIRSLMIVFDHTQVLQIFLNNSLLQSSSRPSFPSPKLIHRLLFFKWPPLHPHNSRYAVTFHYILENPLSLLSTTRSKLFFHFMPRTSHSIFFCMSMTPLPPNQPDQGTGEHQYSACEVV